MEDTDRELCCFTRRMFKGKRFMKTFYTFSAPKKTNRTEYSNCITCTYMQFLTKYYVSTDLKKRENALWREIW